MFFRSLITNSKLILISAKSIFERVSDVMVFLFDRRRCLAFSLLYWHPQKVYLTSEFWIKKILELNDVHLLTRDALSCEKTEWNHFHSKSWDPQINISSILSPQIKKIKNFSMVKKVSRKTIIMGKKSDQNEACQTEGRTHGRTDAHQTFEAPYANAPLAITQILLE